jgi:S1-C subfamily serine protease
MSDTNHRAAAMARIVLVIATAAALLTACTSGSGTSTTRSRAPAGDSQGAALEQVYEHVVRTVLPSIVQINASSGSGSGVIYDNKGHIVTNAHVVGDEDQFQVTPATGGQPMPATLVARYPPEDLAVIQVSGGLPVGPATFGDSSELVVGQIVLAMGNPLGLTGSVTDGIVSAVGRTVTESPSVTIADMVQTSAAINPGNSGGALVDTSGHVIGIPTLGATDQTSGGVAPGLGFAISANTAKRITDQIIAHGRVTSSGRAALNITATSVVDPEGRPVGAGVVSVAAGGSADKAGIHPGDVISKVNDTPVTGVTQLNEALAELSPGAHAEVTVVRDGQRTTLPVTLGEL